MSLYSAVEGRTYVKRASIMSAHLRLPRPSYLCSRRPMMDKEIVVLLRRPCPLLDGTPPFSPCSARGVDTSVSGNSFS